MHIVQVDPNDARIGEPHKIDDIDGLQAIACRLHSTLNFGNHTKLRLTEE